MLKIRCIVYLLTEGSKLNSIFSKSNYSRESMRFQIQIVFLFLLAISFSFQHKYINHKIEIKLNYKSSDLLLRWFNDLPNRRLIDSISIEPGIQIMADNVRLNSDPEHSSLRSFKEELEYFAKNDTSNRFSYGTDLAWKMREKSSLLLQKIKTERIEDMITERALVYIPTDYLITTKCKIYFVLTGWEWGDAYVCNIREQYGKYTISDEGEPSIVINLSLISKLYGQTVEEQLKVLNGILSHEIFHFLFANYKKQSPMYNSGVDSSGIGKLFEVLLNEGIAHYIDKKSVLLLEYGTNPKFAEEEKQNIDRLNESFLQLAGNNLNEAQKLELLRKASVGKYWSKYGSISGMFMAYHIEKEKGRDALKKSIQKGPFYFIKQYLDLRNGGSNLPELNFEMRSFIGRNIGYEPD